MTQRTVSILPNPYCSLDVDGEPAGAIPIERMRGVYIGASLDQSRTRRSSQSSIRLRGQEVVNELLDTNTSTKFLFRDIPEEFPLTGYYRAMAKEGSVIAADEASAKKLGVKFLPPEEVVEQWKETSAAKFYSETGSYPAWYQKEE